MIGGNVRLTVRDYATLEDAKGIIDDYMAALGHAPTHAQR